MEITKVDNLFLQTPTNDISNISDIVNDDGMAIEGMDDTLNKQAYNSSWAMTRFASMALNKFPDIKEVILIDIPVRVDKMKKKN